MTARAPVAGTPARSLLEVDHAVRDLSRLSYRRGPTRLTPMSPCLVSKAKTE